MSTLIVYYSQGGNTEYTAQKIARETGFDTLRIEPKKEYPSTGFRKFFWGGKSAVMAETPELLPYEFDSASYDRIVIGFPVWAGTITPPIRTFVKENDLSGKKVAAFACQSGSGAEKAFGKLKEAAGISGFIDTLILIDPKDKPDSGNDNRIRSFCEMLKDDQV